MLLIYVSIIKSILSLFVPFVVTPPAKTIYSSTLLLTNDIAVALLLGYDKVPVILVIVVLSVDNYTTSIISVY